MERQTDSFSTKRSETTEISETWKEKDTSLTNTYSPTDTNTYTSNYIHQLPLQNQICHSCLHTGVHIHKKFKMCFVLDFLGHVHVKLFKCESTVDVSNTNAITTGKQSPLFLPFYCFRSQTTKCITAIICGELNGQSIYFVFQKS